MYVPTLWGERLNDAPTTLYAVSVRRFVIVLTRTLALYAFAAWAYVALVAVFLPRTLDSNSPISPSHHTRTRSAR